ncbi:hypothetical protein [Algisphaera agarilytica]|uniref:Lipoprotein n=1 Tax=Algisphaera agarilytica TaxID=1385975 RepID=A0A7X0LK03_9BACT|nr:hypothetical protein [Algisphaera agarilytica]MBB6429930.1 hypothetical protein [Algisphaera agarilytica]
MTRFTPLLLLSLSVLISTGCDVVYVDEPFGRGLVEHHTAHYVGHYSTGEGVIQVQQTGDSTLQAAWVEYDQRDGFRMMVVDIELRYWGGKTIAYVRLNYDASSVEPDDNEDPDQLERWLFAYAIDQNAAANPPNPLVFAAPRESVFADLVRRGELPGEADGECTRLDPAAEEELAAMLVGRGAEELFDHTEPLVFTRLPARLK